MADCSRPPCSRVGPRHEYRWVGKAERAHALRHGFFRVGTARFPRLCPPYARLHSAMSKEHPRTGMFKKITSLANPLVKDIRALQLKKHRDETGLFIAEGQKLVRDAADSGWPIEKLAYSAALAGDAAIGSLAAATKASGGAVLEVSAQVLEKITRRENPQNVVGVFKQRFESEALIGREGIWVALDRVRDPGNLGTIVRTADAAGVKGIALVGMHCDPFGLEAVRATMGSIFNVPLVRANEDALIAQAKRLGARLIGTHLTATTIDFRQVDYSQPLILLMGNEQQGLTEKLSAACDALVRIPMHGRADSLNLAVSTGLMIYEAMRRDLR
jgi:RNA methyltransferase, TrmH family